MAKIEISTWSGHVKIMDGRGKMQTFVITQNNRLPLLTIVVYDENGDIKNYTGATVTLSMINERDKALKINKAAAVLTNAAADPHFTYSWAVGDLDTPGSYLCELEITSGGLIESPSELFRIIVRKELN